MKKLVLAFAMCLSFCALSQQQGVDRRLLAYHGDKIISLYESNKEAYNSILYKLDNSFYIVDKSKYTGPKESLLDISTVKSNTGESFNVSLLADLSAFNFMLYNFRVSQTEKTIYDLGDGRLMIFYSLNEVKENYSRGVNTSNDEKTK